jgi:starch synthase
MTIAVLSVASEAVPLVKTGGLADVAGALPGAVAAHGVVMTTLLPGYPAVMAGLKRGKVLHAYDSLLGEPARLVAGKLGGHPLIVLDAPGYYARDGGPYAAPGGRDWDDNWQRFGALERISRAGRSRACGSMCSTRTIGRRPWPRRTCASPHPRARYRP